MAWNVIVIGGIPVVVRNFCFEFNRFYYILYTTSNENGGIRSWARGINATNFFCYGIDFPGVPRILPADGAHTRLVTDGSRAQQTWRPQTVGARYGRRRARYCIFVHECALVYAPFFCLPCVCCIYDAHCLCVTFGFLFCFFLNGFFFFHFISFAHFTYVRCADRRCTHTLFGRYDFKFLARFFHYFYYKSYTKNNGTFSHGCRPPNGFFVSPYS